MGRQLIGYSRAFHLEVAFALRQVKQYEHVMPLYSQDSTSHKTLIAFTQVAKGACGSIIPATERSLPCGKRHGHMSPTLKQGDTS